jgi:hypothetical protein
MATVYCVVCKRRIGGWSRDRPPTKSGDELGIEEGCRRGSGCNPKALGVMYFTEQLKIT